MNDPEIDRIFSDQDEILPSSGFAASVMEAVRREALAPPPIPFPWKRAVPFFALAGLAVVFVVIFGVEVIAQYGRMAGTPQAAVTSLPPMSSMMPQGVVGTAVGWTVGALTLTLVSVKLSMRLATGRT
jgi:hypothetical protein